MGTLKYLYLNNAVISLFSIPLQMGHKDNFLLIKYCLVCVLLEKIETVSVHTALKIKFLDEEQ